jgi:hypothetical protein
LVIFQIENVSENDVHLQLFLELISSAIFLKVFYEFCSIMNSKSKKNSSLRNQKALREKRKFLIISPMIYRFTLLPQKSSHLKLVLNLS